MKRRLLVPLVLIILVLALAPLSSVGAIGGASGPSRCDVLSGPNRVHLSGAGEAALLIICNRVVVPQAVGITGESVPLPIGSANQIVNSRTGDFYPNITQSEASIAVDGDNIVIGYNDSGQFSVPTMCSLTGFSRSADGGVTWTDMGSLSPGPAGGLFGDPVVMHGDVPGEIFFASLGTSPGGTCGIFNTSVIVVKTSTDGGATFPTIANASRGVSAANFQDKEWMAVDTSPTSPFIGRVYVCWTEFGGPGARIRISRPQNNAASFSNPGTLGTNGQGCQVDTSADGKIYVSWWNFATNTLEIRRHDGAGAWTPAVTIASVIPPGTFDPSCGRNALNGSIRIAPLHTMAVNPDNGDVYVAWNDGVNPDVLFSRSADLGVTWSSPIVVHDPMFGGSTDNDQFFPAMAVAPDGTIMINYYSRHEDPANFSMNLWAAGSTDNGISWTNAALSDVLFDPPPISPVNFDTTIVRCYMGDYNGITSDATSFYHAWGDNRLDTSIYPGGPAIDHPDPDVWNDETPLVIIP